MARCKQLQIHRMKLHVVVCVYYLVLYCIPRVLCASEIVDGRSTAENLKTLPYPFDFDIPGGSGKPELEFACSVPDFPDGLMVYRVVHPKVDKQTVRSTGKEYGFKEDAEVTTYSSRAYLWLIERDRTLDVDPSNGTFALSNRNRSSLTNTPLSAYPSFDRCKGIANDFLNSHEMLPSDAVLTTVTARNIASIGYIETIYHRTIGGYKARGAGAQINVRIGPDGEVGEFLKAWQDLRPYNVYPLRTVEQALQDLRNGGGLSEDRTGTIEKVELLYYTSPVRQNYVQPFYLFRCKGPNGAFVAKVPAVDGKYLMPIETRGILNAEDSGTSVSQTGG